MSGTEGSRARRRGRPVLAAAAVFLLAPSGAAAQDQPAAPVEERPESSVLLLMDSSGSMAADDGSGTRRIDAAKAAVNGLLESFPRDPQTKVGLRVFGGRLPNNDKTRGCRDTRLIFPAAQVDPASMKRAVRSYRPTGFTPIALSLELAARDLPDTGRRTIVLVSDGQDTCQPPSPCAVAARVARRGVDIRIEAIGFRVNPGARRQLRCIARAGRGSYRDAENAEQLSQELRAISTRAVRVYRPVGTPVRGAPSARQATEIQPGQYLDSLQPDSVAWYAVRLDRGETLTAAGTLVAPSGHDVGGIIGGAFRLTIFNPHLQQQVFGGGSGVAANLLRRGRAGVESVGVFGLPAGYGGDDPVEFARSDRYGEPGDYYLKIEFEDNGSKELRNQADGDPFALELLIDVLGRESVTRLPVGRPTRAARRRASAGGDDSDGLGGVALGIAALGAGLAGVGAGSALGRGRRPA